MTAPLLLDTCAAIWITHNAALAPEAVQALDAAADAGRTVYVSPITAWEVGLHVARGRMTIASRPHAWFDRVIGAPGVALAGMPPAVLIDSSALPGTPPSDPADRIIIATAREYGYRVVTRDRRILDYADGGFVMALPC